MAMAKAPYLEMGVAVFFSEIFNRGAAIAEEVRTEIIMRHGVVICELVDEQIGWARQGF
jgi:hypothetical protein